MMCPKVPVAVPLPHLLTILTTLVTASHIVLATAWNSAAQMQQRWVASPYAKDYLVDR